MAYGLQGERGPEFRPKIQMLDNGFPLVTELNILKDLVKPPNLVTRVMDSLSISGQARPALPRSWANFQAPS